MAGVNNVVTRGYSIGTIALVVLRGYTAGSVPEAEQIEVGHVLTLGERPLTLSLRSRSQIVSVGKRNLTLTAPKE